MSGTGGFALLKFPQPHHVGGLHDIVCIEKLSGSLYVEDEVEVYHYHLAFSQLVRGSLEAADSRHLVSEIDPRGLDVAQALASASSV